MKLISKEEIKRIWSLRFAIATAVVSTIPAAQAMVPEWVDFLPPKAKAVASGLVVAGAVATAVSRVIVQKPIDPAEEL